MAACRVSHPGHCVGPWLWGQGRGRGQGCGGGGGRAACAAPEGCCRRPQDGTLRVGTAPQNKGASARAPACQPAPRHAARGPGLCAILQPRPAALSCAPSCSRTLHSVLQPPEPGSPGDCRAPCPQRTQHFHRASPAGGCLRPAVPCSLSPALGRGSLQAPGHRLPKAGPRGGGTGCPGRGSPHISVRLSQAPTPAAEQEGAAAWVTEQRECPDAIRSERSHGTRPATRCQWVLRHQAITTPHTALSHWHCHSCCGNPAYKPSTVSNVPVLN